jgi:serine O-acetyltransferase
MVLNPDSELWSQIKAEASQLSADEPFLTSFYHGAILDHASLAAGLAYHLASKLESNALSAIVLRELFDSLYAGEPALAINAGNDLIAWYDRDPACDLLCMPFLYFKGFHALQAYRLSHCLWQQQRQSLALFLQNRISAVFDVDIHPAARIGEGIMIDHATGVVIGETAVIGNDVSLLHSVTLGGCGSAGGDRHPRIADGVMVSAGAKLLGNIRIGEGAKIAAGSVVLEDVAAHTTVAGVPAKVVGRPREAAPARDMNQGINGDD